MAERRRIGVARMIGATLFALGLGGCSTGDSGSASGPLDLDALPWRSLQEVTRIGSVDDPDYGFSRIGAVDVDRDGNVWIFEALARELRQYAPTGELLGRVGGRGDGPGEFSQYGTIGFGVEGDTIWAFDTGNRRLTLFGRDGTVLSDGVAPQITVGGHVPGGVMTVDPAQLGSDGLFVGHHRSGVSPMFDPTVQLVDSLRLPRVRFDLDGEVVDTVGWYPVVGEGRMPEIIQVGQSEYLVPPPPSSGPLLVLQPDGYVVIDRVVPGTPDALRITRFGHAGDTVRTGLFSYVPKPFPQAVLDTAVALHIGSGGMVIYGSSAGGVMISQRPEDSAAARARLAEAIDFPPLQPPVSGTWLSTSDGGLWLEREDTGTDSRTWTLFDAEDRPVGQVDVPRSLRLRWSDGSDLWGVMVDETGIPWLVGYRLAAAGG